MPLLINEPRTVEKRKKERKKNLEYNETKILMTKLPKKLFVQQYHSGNLKLCFWGVGMS